MDGSARSPPRVLLAEKIGLLLGVIRVDESSY